MNKKLPHKVEGKDLLEPGKNTIKPERQKAIDEILRIMEDNQITRVEVGLPKQWKL